MVQVGMEPVPKLFGFGMLRASKGSQSTAFMRGAPQPL